MLDLLPSICIELHNSDYSPGHCSPLSFTLLWLVLWCCYKTQSFCCFELLFFIQDWLASILFFHASFILLSFYICVIYIPQIWLHRFPLNPVNFVDAAVCYIVQLLRPDFKIQHIRILTGVLNLVCSMEILKRYSWKESWIIGT